MLVNTRRGKVRSSQGMQAAAHRPTGGGPGVSETESGCASARSPSGAPSRQPCSRARTTCRVSAACADPLQQGVASQASGRTGLHLGPPAKRGDSGQETRHPLNLPDVERKDHLYTERCLKAMLHHMLYQITERPGMEGSRVVAGIRSGLASGS